MKWESAYASFFCFHDRRAISVQFDSEIEADLLDLLWNNVQYKWAMLFFLLRLSKYQDFTLPHLNSPKVYVSFPFGILVSRLAWEDTPSFFNPRSVKVFDAGVKLIVWSPTEYIDPSEFIIVAYFVLKLQPAAVTLGFLKSGIRFWVAPLAPPLLHSQIWVTFRIPCLLCK